VDTKSEIREFLTSRRAKITPDQAGLPTYGDNRRVPGLRREEVTLLAGVSVDYYTRLERGNTNGVSDSVLGALARALQLDDAERAHLFDLARSAQTTASPRRRFRTRWAAHNVRYHDTGVKQLHHLIVGDLSLTFETMQLSADDGLVMFAYTAEPGSKSAEALKLLGSWAATLDQTDGTPDQAETVPATDGA